MRHGGRSQRIQRGLLQSLEKIFERETLVRLQGCFQHEHHSARYGTVIALCERAAK